MEGASVDPDDEGTRWNAHIVATNSIVAGRHPGTGPSTFESPPQRLCRDACRPERHPQQANRMLDAGAVVEEDNENGENGVKEDDFGGWDDEEDDKIIERSLKKALKRKGIDPKATKSKAVQSLSKGK